MWTRPVDAQVSQATGVGVVGQDLVEDGVGDLVTDLVGMALGDGLGRKQMILCHFCTSLALGCVLLLTASYTFIKLMQQKNAPNRSSERCTLIFRFPAGFGTLCSRTGCRASQGLSPQPLLISRYSVCPGNILSLLRRNVKKRCTLFRHFLENDAPALISFLPERSLPRKQKRHSRSCALCGAEA